MNKIALSYKNSAKVQVLCGKKKNLQLKYLN